MEILIERHRDPTNFNQYRYMMIFVSDVEEPKTKGYLTTAIELENIHLHRGLTEGIKAQVSYKDLLILQHFIDEEIKKIVLATPAVQDKTVLQII